ncbi:hypothetical protein CCMSSC00406_0007462 [Pleurotus cornucopiae]|uniref:Uncharacterized protein n=1 Tax=Pleurotus cornucopiae TaxID=5321 RepID=A0ACB7J3H6_PLECO|nr:hypothetical protein CCMSSC00406_0007462 [Pleurotus cornucopiae]
MLAIALLLLSLSIAPSLQTRPTAPKACKTFPGDPDWPSPATWHAFNASVDGRLIRTVPIGSPCHNPNFNATECDIIKANWHDPAFHELSPSSIQDSLWANKSCDPFSPPDSRCIIGNYVQYTVNVSTQDHIKKTLTFAKQHNIRFVLRNTGHDYMGKSTGAGGLAIWTGNMKKTEWIPHFKSAGYCGPAVKVAAGVSVIQLYEEADARGFAVVAGACPTVGFAGGYIQGGGHSALSSKHGLAADNTLEFEVITTTGQLLTASPTQNSDLYWAISGGGGGTYGIVWSATVKVFPDEEVSGASVSFAVGPNVTRDLWWEGINFYTAQTPNYTAAGAVSYAFYSGDTFNLSPLFLPGGNKDQARKLVQPFLDKLVELGIPHNVSIDNFPGYLPAYTALFPSALFGVSTQLFGGRLLPRSLWDSPQKLAPLQDSIRNIVDAGALAFDIAIRPTLVVAGNPKNAVLPAWRAAERTFNPNLPWDDTANFATTVANQLDTITHNFDEQLRKLTPGSGAYLNEADPFEPNFKEAFYGPNYNKLLAIKDKFDPDQLLFGSTAVGGDRWVPQPDGRLCRA